MFGLCTVECHINGRFGIADIYIYPYRTPSKRSLNIFLSRTQLDQYWNSVYSGTAPKLAHSGRDHIVLTGSPTECANFDWQICVQVVLEFTLVAGGAKWEMGYG